MLRSVKLFWDTLYLCLYTPSFARKIWITYKRACMTCHQNSSNQPDGSKHVEMFRTKCQPKVGTDKMPTKSWDGQNANHRKKSGWHLVWLALCPVGMLSYHPIQPHELVTYFKEKPFKCDHCNFLSTLWKDTSTITIERNRSSATSATILLLNLFLLLFYTS